MIYKSIIFISFCTAISCNRGPKIIPITDESTSDIQNAETSPFQQSGNIAKGQVKVDNKLHKVEIVEVLPTDKYAYLKVSEQNETYWIATLQSDYKVGESFLHTGGVPQHNFKSKDLNRIFEEILFVSEIISADHGLDDMPQVDNNSGRTSVSIPKFTKKEIDQAGSVRIAEIVANPEKYAGKEIKVSGQCVKLNPDIMGLNWIHLKDGSQDEFDFVITSEVPVYEGNVVTMTGTVTLNKDFGAGYYYDIIVEKGAVVQ